MKSSGIITFLSDFGIQDSYVSEVKGAILSVFPNAQICDVTHMIPPFAIRIGAFLLSRIVSVFPKGTVHLAVIDPGVGTDRRPLAVKCDGFYVVGPDNGILSWVTEKGCEWRVIEREDFFRKPTSLTFHARDIFGPVAAALAGGLCKFDEIGQEIHDPIMLKFPSARFLMGRVETEVLYVDSFGNVLLALEADRLKENVIDVIEVKGMRFGCNQGSYASGDGIIWHKDSSGFVELSLREGRAVDLLGCKIGDRIVCILR